jgi:hypothetical protein
LQHLIVEGLLNSGSTEAKKFAENIATRWVRTNYAAYKSTGAMHEKYDVEACGKSGGGGEYKPQVWSYMLQMKVKDFPFVLTMMMSMFVLVDKWQTIHNLEVINTKIVILPAFSYRHII